MPSWRLIQRRVPVVFPSLADHSLRLAVTPNSEGQGPLQEVFVPVRGLTCSRPDAVSPGLRQALLADFASLSDVPPSTQLGVHSILVSINLPYRLSDGCLCAVARSRTPGPMILPFVGVGSFI